MNYVVRIIPAAVLILAAAGFIYFFINKLRQKKRGKISGERMTCEVLLLAWLILVVYITLLMPFGRGYGTHINVHPLYFFRQAIEESIYNRDMISQFILNALMFVPFGLLFPFVFYRAGRKWYRVVLPAAALSVIIEFLQTFVSRGTDVDDVIANTAGALLGYVIYRIIENHMPLDGRHGKLK